MNLFHLNTSILFHLKTQQSGCRKTSVLSVCKVGDEPRNITLNLNMNLSYATVIPLGNTCIADISVHYTHPDAHNKLFD